MPDCTHRRHAQLRTATALALLLLCSGSALGQFCELYFEGFASFGGPVDFDNGTYRVEWCESGASVSSSELCLTGNTYRLNSSSHDPIIWVHVGWAGCTAVKLEFDFGEFATTGTVLKYATSPDTTLNCSASIDNYAGSLDLPDGVCYSAEHVVTLSEGERSVYWKFDHGLPSTNAFFLDNVRVSLETCDCAGTQPDHGCCEIGGPGCDDPVVEACVCAQDAYCCEIEWDAQCVAEVDSFGCGTCGGGGCATEFNADFGNYFQSGSVCDLWPAKFETCEGYGPWITSGTACGGSGDYAMSFNTGYPYSAATTTCLDLSTAAAASLNFAYTKTGGSLGPRIEISIDGGGSFSTVWNAPFSFAGGCVAECLDLGDFVGLADVRLKFSSGSSSANGAAFDDLLLVLDNGCPTCTAPSADAGPDKTLCPDGTAVLEGNASGGSGGSCPGDHSPSWSGLCVVSGADTFSPTVSAPGQYFLTTSCGACAAIDSVIVALDDSGPAVDAGATTSLPCEGGPLQLNGSAAGCAGSLSISWTTSAGGNIVSGADTLTPTVDAAGTYTLHASCDGGCESADNVLVSERITGDWNGDAAIDVGDFVELTACLAGPGGGLLPGCACGDFEPDGDVDVHDFAQFQPAFDTATTFTGACCDADGVCTEVTEAACVAAGGEYHGDGDTCAAVICPFGRYSNEIDPITSFYGNGADLADDMTLTGLGARKLVSYELAAYGGNNGGGAFDATVSLYTDCPGNGGSIIAGTTFTWNGIPDDEYVYVLTADLAAAPATIPDSVWMVVSFSTAQAGWIVAGSAETGYTADLFGSDEAPWGCGQIFTGESPPYAGFWAKLECVESGTARAETGTPRTATTRRAGPKLR